MIKTLKLISRILEILAPSKKEIPLPPPELFFEKGGIVRQPPQYTGGIPVKLSDGHIMTQKQAEELVRIIDKELIEKRKESL